MLYKFTGAGNDFVVADGRHGGVEELRDAGRIVDLCREYGTDGLMILSCHSDYDFRMEFYNPDGSGGMMCGNGGRCIVAFADMLGLKPASPDGEWRFLAPDGPHTARILQGSTSLWTVRLKMKDVDGIKPVLGGYFINTGTRHFVKFVEDVNAVDVQQEGTALRWDKSFQPEGTNVNFVQITPQGLLVRTFEKGVEGETLACGTGLTASALVYAFLEHPKVPVISLQCRRGDYLTVEFTPGPSADSFREVYLTGPAEYIPE